MARRKIVVDDFSGGINQVFDDVLLPGGTAPQILGCISIEEGHLLRLGGKFPLAAASRKKEATIDIYQLTFASSRYILTHHTSNREIHEGVRAPYVDTPDGIEEYAF